ncbi:MAG: glycoside hydrolase family 38 C-terminal domain-containing protein [Spirochaetia bacterium]
MKLLKDFQEIEKHLTGGYWPDRLAGELDFAVRLFGDDPEKGKILRKGLDLLESRVKEEGAVTRKTALETEEALAELGPSAREFTLVLAAHAHIDMNWMWGFQETVAITIATVRTVLVLLERYREFVYSQSQASVYKILEDYAPDLAEKVREMIRRGRWEVTASQWVEADNNLPGAESFARHALYSRRYMTEVYDAPEESFRFIFMPDTFGHHPNTPEILAQAGVKYFYHGRGESPHYVYRWKGPSGRSITAYNDPKWYDTHIDHRLARHLGAYHRAGGLKTGLVVYGVGDHGGGPTVRDIERIQDMMSWPVFPVIRFGMYRDFFRKLEGETGRLPEIGGERNFIYTGCYTSQARIKAANRISESALYTAELFEGLTEISMGTSQLKAAEKHHLNLRDAWIGTLFNQFHDILPGSGVDLTRFHALGKFQDAAAAATAASGYFLSALTGEEVPEVFPAEDTAYGAGVGYASASFRPGLGNRTIGKERRYRIFNQFFRDRNDYTEILLWDWPGKPEHIRVKDENGEILPSAVIEVGQGTYWRHTFIRVAVRVELLGLGFRDVLVTDEGEPDIANEVFHPWGRNNWLFERPKEYSLYNEHVWAEFDPETFRIISFRDRRTGKDLVPSDSPGAGFILYGEEEIGMSAWLVGRLMEKTVLGSGSKLLDYNSSPDSPVKWLSWQVPFPGTTRSYVKVKAVLTDASSALRFETEVFWDELGEKGKTIPRLVYHFPFSLGSDTVMGDVPGGVVTRDLLDLDIPFLSFAAFSAPDDESPGMMVASSETYGYRAGNLSLEAILLRSSIGPDPVPDAGTHRFTFHWMHTASSTAADTAEAAFRLNNPPIPYTGFGSGKLGSGRFLEIRGTGVLLQSVKRAEGPDWNGAPKTGKIIIKLIETAGDTAEISIFLPGPVRNAYFVDSAEQPAAGECGLDDNQVSIKLEPYRCGAVLVEMADSN